MSSELGGIDESLPALHGEPALDVAAVLSVQEATEATEGARQRLQWWVPSVLFHALLLGLASQLLTFSPVLPPLPKGMEVVPIDLDQGSVPEVAGSEARPDREAPQVVPQQPSPNGTFVSLPPNPDPVVPPPHTSLIAESNHRTETEMQAKKVVQSPEVVAERTSEARNEGAVGKNTPSAPQGPPGDAGQDSAVDRARDGSPGNEQASTSAEGGMTEDRPGSEHMGQGASTPQMGRGGLNLFPDRRQLTSLLRYEGSGQGARQGAPDANLLDGQLGDLTRVNAKGTPYHAFFSAVRRQFNFYYQQAGDNLRATDLDRRIRERTYVTRFWVKLLPDGQVGGVQIVASSGVPAFDGLVLQALRAASPFPAVPGGLLQEDGNLTLGGECRLGVGMSSPVFLPSR